jgi:Ca2+-binding EF-hand superfamily protein
MAAVITAIRHKEHKRSGKGDKGGDDGDDCDDYWKDAVSPCTLTFVMACTVTQYLQEKKETLKKMGSLLQEFDEDKSGDLDMKEFSNLIADHEVRSGKDNPTVPSEAEISWILQSAGKNKEKAIDATELEHALKLWDSYARNRAKFEKMFSVKIEANQRLEFDQLKPFLTKLTAYPLKVLACSANSSR